MHDRVIDLAQLEAYGVDGANERGAEADEVYAAGAAAVEALAAVAPGPELASALGEVGKLPMSTKSRIELVGHWERQRAWTDAQAMVALGDAFGNPDVESDRWVIADVARTLHLSENSVGTRFALMRHVSAGLNGTWEALNVGAVTSAHLWVLANVTRDATPEQTAAVEEQVLDKAIARKWTPAKLADAARAALIKADPAAAEQRARDAKRQRSDVTLRSDEDMMAALVARTDAWTARQIMDEINRRADAMRRAGDERALGELRMAVFAQALLGDLDPCESQPDEGSGLPHEWDEQEAEPTTAHQARRHPKRATALLLITLPTLLGGDQPGYLDGYGPITAGLARRIAAGDIRFRRLLLDPETGKPRDLGDNSYELSAEMRRWLEARDRTCRFPGCGARAVYCDADHAVEWPLGETSCANCGLLCRTHHNFKTSKAWRLFRNTDGSVDWHSPNGFEWHVDPATYDEFLDPPDFGPPTIQARSSSSTAERSP